MRRYPQRLVNVKVTHKEQVLNHLHVQEAIRDAEAQLADKGRVLLRLSGTENLLRVMVEGQDAQLVEKVVNELAQVVENVSVTLSQE